MSDYSQQDIIEQIRDQLTEDQRKKVSQFKVSSLYFIYIALNTMYLF